MHARDVEHLIGILRQLTDKPNTVLVVEHDESVMLKADHIIDMGPGAGVYGGQIVGQGTPEDIIQQGSVTGQYLSGELKIQAKNIRRKAMGYLEIHNARLHNLKNLSVRIPQNVQTCLTGVFAENIRDGFAFDPIEVALCPDKTGYYRRLDGAHRWSAYKSTGVEEVKAIIKNLDGNDPLLYAATKAIGPKQLTEDEARDTARRAYSGNSNLSSTDIGKLLAGQAELEGILVNST